MVGGTGVNSWYGSNWGGKKIVFLLHLKEHKLKKRFLCAYCRQGGYHAQVEKER